MRWENTTEDWPALPDIEIPTELLDGLERLGTEGDLLKARLRWRPHQTAATGFLTKDRLLELRREPIVEVARTLATLARGLYDRGGCEPKFEAQVHRELEAIDSESRPEGRPEGRPEREWRSITFYVNQPPRTSSFEMSHDEFEPESNDRGESPWGEPVRAPESNRGASPWAEPVRSGGSSFPSYDEYAGFVDLLRSDPNGFAIVMLQHSNNRTVAILERMLGASASRLDRVLATQISSTRYLNEALQTLTRGASEVAGIGVNLFNQGLEGQARLARMEHETELGRERTELMRDAVKHGSLLAQAVLMANQTKQQQSAASAAAPQTAQRGGAPTTPSPSPAPPGPTSVSQSADDEIEIKTRHLLELMTDAALEDLRRVAPSLASVFDELRAAPVTADRVRAVIHDAQARVDPVELGLASKQFGAEISHAFGVLVMRVLSEDRS